MKKARGVTELFNKYDFSPTAEIILIIPRWDNLEILNKSNDRAFFLIKGKMLQNIDRNKMRVLPWMFKLLFLLETTIWVSVSY